jgi:hypothetical protein
MKLTKPLSDLRVKMPPFVNSQREQRRLRTLHIAQIEPLLLSLREGPFDRLMHDRGESHFVTNDSIEVRETSVQCEHPHGKHSVDIR